MFTFFFSSIYAENFEKTDIILKTDSGNILFFVKYANKEHAIINSFYAVFESYQNDPKAERLVTFSQGIIKNKFGKTILDLNDERNNFYGFKISISYPKNKRFTPGLNLDPYYGSSDHVGDSLRIQWDTKNYTFQQNPSIIP